MRGEWVLGIRWGLLIVLMGVLLSLGMGAAKAPDRGTPLNLELLKERGIGGLDYSMADTSLAVREQVDFLLTPALLVQEAISDDVVLTYPEE